MPFMKVDFDFVEQAQKENVSRQLANYINERLGPLVVMLPTKPEYIAPYTQFIIPSSYENHFIDSRAFSLYVITSFMLGYNWPKDPQYRYLMDIYGEFTFPYDEMLNLLMYQAEEDVRQRLKNLPDIHAKTIELLQKPVQTLTQHAFMTYREDFYQLRKLSRPVEQQTLFKTYETDFRAYMKWHEAKEHTSQHSCQERWSRQNMGLPVDGKTSIDDLVSEQQYALLIHSALCLAFGRFYLKTPLHKDLHEILVFDALNLDQTKNSLERYLTDHIGLVERYENG